MVLIERTSAKEMSLMRQRYRQYFQDETIANFRLVKLLARGGTLNPYVPKGENWEGVATHTSVQMATSETVGRMMALSESEITILKQAALVHDHDKREQVLGLAQILKAKEQGEITEEECAVKQYEFFEKSEQHSIDGMRIHGVPEEVIQVASADGHPALPSMIDGSASKLQRIFHYIGDVVADDTIVSVDERVKKNEGNPKYAAMNKYGREQEWTKGKTLYEVQREVGHQIEKEIIEQIIAADTLPPNLVQRIQENPHDLPAVIRIYWNAVALYNDSNEDRFFNKTVLWELSQVNPKGNVCYTDAEYRYAREALFFNGIPPVDPRSVDKSKGILVFMPWTDRDRYRNEISMLQRDLGGNELIEATDIFYFWNVFFKQKNFLDVPQPIIPEAIICTGIARHHDGSAKMNVNVSKGLNEIGEYFGIPVIYLVPKAVDLK